MPPKKGPEDQQNEAGSTKLMSTSPSQSKEVMAALVPAATSLTQPA